MMSACKSEEHGKFRIVDLHPINHSANQILIFSGRSLRAFIPVLMVEVKEMKRSREAVRAACCQYEVTISSPVQHMRNEREMYN